MAHQEGWESSDRGFSMLLWSNGLSGITESSMISNKMLGLHGILRILSLHQAMHSIQRL